MDTLTIRLTAALVDIYATRRSQTKAEISIVNNSGWLAVEDFPGVPRSVHWFLINDASNIGFPPLSGEQVFDIFAIACSLISPRVLFSSLQPDRFSPIMRFGQSSEVKIVESLTDKNIVISENTIRSPSEYSILNSVKVEIDATNLLDIIKRLVNFRFFEWKGRTISELNILDALKRYEKALQAGEPFACYNALFMSLEKAIQADKKGDAFDAAVSATIGLSPDNIKEIREFNNRIKHSIRNNKEFDSLKRGESNISRLSTQLKMATDKVLLLKI